MKKFFAVMLIALTANVFAQNVNIKNGASFKLGGKEYLKSVLTAGQGGTSVLLKAGFLGNKFRVLNLDGELQEKSKFEVEIPKVENKKVKYIWSGQLGRSVYFMSKYWDRKSKTYTMFASELDPTNGKFKGHKKVVSVTDENFKMWSNPFSAARSIDSSKVLLVTRYPTKRKENARYNLKVVNNDMSELWQKDIEFQDEDRFFTLQDFLVDKEGNVHFQAYVRMSRDEKKEKGANSRYQTDLYSYNYKADKLTKYELGFSEQIVQTVDMSINENNELLCVGFYSERKFWGQGYKGFYYMRISPETGKVVASNISPFSKDLLKDIIGERRAEKGKDMPKYKVREVYPLANGGLGIVTEHYVYTKRTSTDSKGNTHTYETWLYGNVLVMYLDKDGKMESSAVLKKKQMCTAKDGNATLFQLMGIGMYPGVNELPYYGIGSMIVGDDIHVLFNDNPKNEVRKQDGKKPKSVRQRNAVTSLTTFKPGGKMATNLLFKAKDASGGYKMPLMPRNSVQFSKNEMIVFGAKGKNFRAASITIK
jgi:hypothetical protein